MAKIILGSYMVRYPLGGMASWVLQYILGFHQLGHEIWFVEKAGYPQACYDPESDTMTDDCSVGAKFVNSLLGRFGLADRWCFVDLANNYYNIERQVIEKVFAEADLFVDMGTHGSWADEAQETGCRVLLDGEPGFTQMKMVLNREAGRTQAESDFYFTTGQNIGTERSTAPDGGVDWHHIFHPVVPELFDHSREPTRGLTTVMNWQSYDPLPYRGQVFGHKDVEFLKFMDLPARTDVDIELSVSGKSAPLTQIEGAGWKTSDAHEVTRSFDSFRDYLASSLGEFTVCKNGFVATNSGWFSDRSAAYLASGRPVIAQETGFSEHLPCGEGLWAVSSVDEAVSATKEILADYEHHCLAGREIANEYLDARVVLGRFLNELGIQADKTSKS